MSSYWMWWIAAAALMAAELLTGTFYLLVVGIGVAFGGLAALAGADAWLQWLAAGVIAVGGTVAIRRWKQKLLAGTPPQAGLDVGQMVRVMTWGADNTARVAYRGSTWDAELASPATAKSESMYIAATRGSVLILSDQRPGAA